MTSSPNLDQITPEQLRALAAQLLIKRGGYLALGITLKATTWKRFCAIEARALSCFDGDHGSPESISARVRLHVMERECLGALL